MRHEQHRAHATRWGFKLVVVSRDDLKPTLHRYLFIIVLHDRVCERANCRVVE
ncbi:unnamed protein product [Chondrus crispus]|uniref:Uncharacterized protein n=1 Tax=Chondrus crispus TaxID=2769 RepID=R7QCS5_CHOCR|nr:unnamed protein product [Chondrus crispus]CDF35874.1 unnamed protein product [Chondrus crispus]|eukprot:XP_005715693.1 unnamed protein product [Chondrus crispus]